MTSLHNVVKQHHSANKPVQSVCSTSANVFINMLIVGGQWCIGCDVKIRSSIWIGNFVDQRFVLLARCIILMTVYRLLFPEGPVKTIDMFMMDITTWSDPIFAAIQVRENVPGAATLMVVKEFILHLANSLYLVFTHSVAIINAVCSGPSEKNALSVVENVIMMPYAFTTSYNTISQGLLALMSLSTLTWILGTIEYYTVGMLAKTMEYYCYKQSEHVTDDYKHLVLSVTNQKLTLGRASFWTSSEANQMFNKAIEAHGSPEHIMSFFQRQRYNDTEPSMCKGTWLSGRACKYPAKFGQYCGHHKHKM